MKVYNTTEVITSNKTIPSDGYSSLYFHNYGNGIVTVFDNVRILPNQGFVWENIPVDGSPILIDDDITVSFDEVPQRELLVLKTYYR